MKVKINYEGKEILVDEAVKSCLDELKRQEEVLDRKNRRHEILWDSILLGGIDAVKESILSGDIVEDQVINEMYMKALEQIIEGLEELDRVIIIDRYMNSLKYKDLSSKYNMPITSVQYRIERALSDMSIKFDAILKKL